MGNEQLQRDTRKRITDLSDMIGDDRRELQCQLQAASERIGVDDFARGRELVAYVAGRLKGKDDGAAHDLATEIVDDITERLGFEPPKNPKPAELPESAASMADRHGVGTGEEPASLEERLEKMTKPQLLELAHDEGVELANGLKVPEIRAELLAALGGD